MKYLENLLACKFSGFLKARRTLNGVYTFIARGEARVEKEPELDQMTKSRVTVT